MGPLVLDKAGHVSARGQDKAGYSSGLGLYAAEAAGAALVGRVFTTFFSFFVRYGRNSLDTGGHSRYDPL